jgi:hypothetical protein
MNVISMAKHYSEEYARSILVDHPVNTDAMIELVYRIDEEMRLLYGAVSPQITVVYGGYLQALNARRWNHPLFQTYLEQAQRNSDAVFLRKRVRSQFYAIVRIKLFLRRILPAFLEEFYAPGNRGYEVAKQDWNEMMKKYIQLTH